ncbi:DUF927 domain-containing protein [Caballeronia sp. LZ035]|uniref:DUF927 domain-containing protein n=1 Tax=Caballeronia sp. LZ035 TaxID=3038568 RepID=UPI00285AA089|nr:DUF927 domain-containing protein [Caballeronia sp. LZ035]MDR5756348.1 DUF927 domain-containing protein [Caballeronia sp. LZ035]
MSTVFDNHQRILEALSFIPPDVERDVWFRIAASLKHEQGDAGFETFDNWSQGSPNYVAADVRDTWRSIHPDGGITIATLFAIAKRYGYNPHAKAAIVVDPVEVERRRAERDARVQKEEQKRAKDRKHAATLALAIIQKSKRASDDHPYLLRKGVAAVDALRELEVEKLQMLIGYRPQSGGASLEGRILIAPVMIKGAVTTVEMIDESGRKAALARGEKAGGCWFVCAVPQDCTHILIAEGVATALSAHSCTGHATVAALSAGNLTKVALAMRAACPDAEITVLADLGTGQQKAVEAARSVAGTVATPEFGDKRGDDETDFNDMHTRFGAGAVAAQIEKAAAPDSADQADKGCVPRGFSISKDGVFYTDDDGMPHWICSPLHVRALVRDRASENWGRLLEWKDADDHPHVWAMPMEMLRSDGADMRGELARLGLDISPSFRARNKLTEYVTTAKPKARGRCVTRTGWHNGAFVFPDRTIGESAERVIFQSEIVMRTYSQAGTLEEWKRDVAAYCSGNSRMLVAVSTAFAGMMLAYSGQESGGLNLVGDSSTGKTTALRASCSVYGGPDYMQRWRATSNGLEGLAALHNDTLLVLDELAQVDPREAGEIAYMLANGTGKARAGRTGSARARQSWRLLFLSAGEIGLAQHMQTGGKKAKAGQEVRLVEIPADAGKGFGLFETLHGQAGGAQLSALINEGCTRSYGVAAIEMLNAIAKEPDVIEQYLRQETAEFIAEHLPADANGQAHRVCQRLALIGLSGEYATDRGITGWQPGETLAAAATCLRAWLENRGGAGNHEHATILSHVKAFFEAHEESRFTDLNDASERPTINRAGYRRKSEGCVEYLVFPEIFKREICSGYDARSVAKALAVEGWIRPSADGRSVRAERIPEKGPTKVYVFTAEIWK